jgi:hypothetical protein
MANTDQREIAETAFRRNPKRDEINDALSDICRTAFARGLRSS